MKTNRKQLVCMVLASVLTLSCAAFADTIYVNDFGTVDQQTVGGTGDWDSETWVWGTAASGTLVYYVNGWHDISQDLDGDTYHGGFSMNGYGTPRWSKKIDAPVGMQLENISITVHGFGNHSQGCNFGAGLSADNSAWTEQSVSGDWSDYPATTLNFGLPSGALSDVYIYIQWQNANLVTDQPWYSAYITDVTVTADVVPEPATIGLLALGFVGLLRRRRK